MNYDNFLKATLNIENITLPAQDAHLKMMPPERRDINVSVDHIKRAKQAAVLALFYPGKNYNTHFVLILRNTYKGHHAAQVSFPGGKPEPQDAGSLLRTATRETFEEVGISAKAVKILKPLSPVYIPPSNFNVQPFIGVLKDAPVFKRDTREVNKIIEVDLKYFLDDKRVITHEVLTSYNAKKQVPAYNLLGYNVWGATAMMLSEIKDLLKQML